MAYLLLVVGLRDEVALRRIINTPKSARRPASPCQPAAGPA